MSNHYHVVVRIDHERARDWSEAEVMNRWGQLCGLPLLVARYQATQESGASSLPAADAKVARECIETYRARLCDLSWFMRGLNEAIARQANREDNCKGRFWEGRFKSQALLDEIAKSERDVIPTIPYRFQDYLELIDWTGRAIRKDKKGAIPAHAPPILTRLNIDPVQWVRQAQHFGRWFPCFAGGVARLKAISQKLDRRWLHGMSAARALTAV
jgi:putative transposase